MIFISPDWDTDMVRDMLIIMGIATGMGMVKGEAVRATTKNKVG